MPEQSKDWVFTINNYCDEEVERLRALFGQDVVTYIVWGYETGSEGTAHLQGFVQFPKKLRRRTVVNQLGGRCFVAARKGTSSEADDYCKKTSDFEAYGLCVSRGRPSSIGVRRGFASAVSEIVGGATCQDVAMAFPGEYVRYSRGFERLYNSLHAHVRTHKSYVVVLYGRLSGTGKTRFVYEAAGPDAFWYLGAGGQSVAWFDGYWGQRVAVLDDFDGSQIPYRLLLRLLDRYPLQVPVKGGSVQWCPSKIYITSNLEPSAWYVMPRADILPLLRRLDCVHHVTENIYDD